MFKLVKYEFRKNRTGLIVMFLICLLLYLMALVGKEIRNESMMVLPVMLLAFYAFSAYVYVLVRGIGAYSSELKSRSAYLLMMVPRSTMSILFAKLLFTLFFALVLFAFSIAVLIGVTGIAMDGAYDLQAMANMLQIFMIQADISSQQITSTLIYLAAEIMVSLLSVVSIGYLSATLSATLLRQGKMRNLVNAIFFVVLLVIVNALNRLVTSDLNTLMLSLDQALRAAAPTLIVNLLLTVLFTSLSALLLKKKVCL